MRKRRIEYFLLNNLFLLSMLLRNSAMIVMAAKEKGHALNVLADMSTVVNAAAGDTLRMMTGMKATMMTSGNHLMRSLAPSSGLQNTPIYIMMAQLTQRLL